MTGSDASQPVGSALPPPTADAATGDVTELSTAALERRLASLAAQVAAHECDFLVTLAEFDAREAWEEVGMKSAAHWLSWRTGMRPGVARERVRVARALTGLPLVRAAFGAGRLSYCKVRALTRVATPATEADLVELALGATGGQLETICRAWRRTLVGEQAASRHLRRGVRRREEEDGAVTYTIRLAPEDAAVLDAAIAAGRAAVLAQAGQAVETPEECALADMVTGDPPLTRADADVVTLIAESFLATQEVPDPGSATVVMIHADLDALVEPKESGRPEESASAEGSGRPEESASAEGGPRAETADSARAAGTGERVDLAGLSLAQRSRATRLPTATTADGTTLSRATVLRLLCGASTRLMLHARDGRPLDLGRRRRHASLKQRAALRERDGGCRFPGCTQRHRLIPHHSVFWSRGGPTDLDLLVLLCPTHHRAVHELGYGVTALGAGRFRFTTPTGQEIPPVGLIRAEGVANPYRTGSIEPLWGGERLDLDWLISGMAGSLLVRSGRIPIDIPTRDLDQALRDAAGWPVNPAA